VGRSLGAQSYKAAKGGAVADIKSLAMEEALGSLF